jgi:hypothetical protein
MGDRAQVKIIFEDGKDIYFYTHWGGSELVNDVANALVRGMDRWGDEEYLARIIFCEMVQSNVMGDTGFGIGTEEHGDLQHPVIEIDMRTSKVNGYSFGEYIERFK